MVRPSEKSTSKADIVKDGRRKNEQKTRTMMDQLEVENPKPDAKAQPKKPPRSPTVIDVTSMFNTLRDIQKHWSPGDQSSAAFPGQASHAPDSSSIRQLPTDAEALGIQASRSKGSLDRTSGGKPIAPYESKEKSSEI